MSLLPVLDLLLIVSAGLMIGVEFSVSVFINPVMRKLPPEPQSFALSLFASRLGFVMPFWYGGCLLLLLAEAYLRRATSAFVPLLCAAGLWAAVIIFTIAVLVPINNRIAKLDSTSPATNWRGEHDRWDLLHKIRILLLFIAFLAAIYSILFLR